MKLEKAIDEAVRQAPPEIRAVIEALQALRGVAQTTAATIVSELGSSVALPESAAVDGLQRAGRQRTLQRQPDPTRLDHQDRQRSSEKGAGGSGVGVSASAERHRVPAAKTEVLAISDEVKQIAWKAQQRLNKRYKAMSARGKNKNQIVTALGRELLGFIWAIGDQNGEAAEARKQHKRERECISGQQSR